MKDTLLIIAIIAGVAWTASKMSEFYPSQLDNMRASMKTSENLHARKNVLSSKQKLSKNDNNHGVNSHVQQHKQSSKRSGKQSADWTESWVSGASAAAPTQAAVGFENREGESLHSIYPTEIVSDQSATELQSDAMKTAAGDSNKKKVALGVPIEKWMLARKHTIFIADSAEPAPLMKVYLQCMEVKQKGMQYVGNNECQKLLEQTQSTPNRNLRLY